MFEGSASCRGEQNENDRVRDLELAGWDVIQTEALQTALVPISSLFLANSLRQSGEIDEHVRALAESEEELPPIIVHHQSMQVIDGMHRVSAAIIRGDKHVKAKLYQGSDSDAFVLAVRMNITHGLPLNRADRTAAAIRIIGSHPHWSDRMIATAVGLAAGTIGKLRRCSTAQTAHSTTRIGKDGRTRPLDSAASRLRISQLLAARPDASIRAIAKEAGVSPSTVHQLRRRLHASQHPSQERQTIQPAASGRPNLQNPRAISRITPSAAGTDVVSILASLSRDPSLRFSDAGRSVLRWLDKYRIGLQSSNKIAETVPDHCARSVAKLARTFAHIWTDLARQLEQRSP